MEEEPKTFRMNIEAYRNYNLYGFKECLTLYISGKTYTIDKRYTPYFQEFHNWLKEEKPIKDKVHTLRMWLKVLIVSVPLIFLSYYSRWGKYDGRSHLTFKKIETVEIGGTFRSIWNKKVN